VHNVLVLSATFDSRAAVKLTLGRDFDAVRLGSEGLRCGRQGVHPVGYRSQAEAAYGESAVVDVHAGLSMRLDSRRDCLAAMRALKAAS
jgi:hypothetical protein